MRLNTVVVKHPDTEGATMTINESDYDPTVHVLVDPDAPANEHAGRSSGTQDTGNTLPAGYEARHVGAGRYKAFVNDEPLKHAEGAKAGEPVTFESKEAATAALVEYAAAQK